MKVKDIKDKLKAFSEAVERIDFLTNEFEKDPLLEDKIFAEVFELEKNLSLSYDTKSVHIPQSSEEYNWFSISFAHSDFKIIRDKLKRELDFFDKSFLDLDIPIYAEEGDSVEVLSRFLELNKDISSFTNKNKSELSKKDEMILKFLGLKRYTSQKINDDIENTKECISDLLNEETLLSVHSLDRLSDRAFRLSVLYSVRMIMQTPTYKAYEAEGKPVGFEKYSAEFNR